MTDVGRGPIGRVGAWRGRAMALAGLAVLLMLPTARADSSFGASSPLTILRAVKRDRYAISEGRGGRQLYVFVDPNCPFCHRLFQRLQPLIGPHHLTVHWIVAGFLRATSAGKAVAILGARGLAANNRLLAMTGPELVPTLLYRNTAGRVVMHQGVPLKPHGLFWTIHAIR